MPNQGRDERTLLLTLLGEVSVRERLLIIGALLVAGLAEGVGLAALLPLLNIIEAGDSPGKSKVTGVVAQAFGVVGFSPSLGSVLAVIVLLITVKALFLFSATRYVGYVVARLDAEFRLRLIGSWMQARWDFFVRQPAGTFVNAIGTECSRAASAFQSVMLMIADAIQVFVYLATAALISPYITAAALACGTGIALLFARLVTQSRQAGLLQTELQRGITSRLSDGLVGMKPIKAMGRGDFLAPLLRREIDELCEALKRQILVAQVMKTQQEPLVAIILAGGFFVAVTTFHLDLAAIVLLGFLFLRSVNNMLNLQKRYQNYVVQESAYRAILDLEAQSRKCTESIREEAGDLAAIERGIELDRVSFAYGERSALDQVSVVLPANALTVLTGLSGGGKTTFVDLLAGLYEPSAGEIRVDGVRLSTLNLRLWRRHIGYVPQEMFLFHDSIYANVAMGDPEISLNDVRTALEAVGLWEFVAGLEHGIDTIVGERGSKLSGGQRQRISLARALAGRPALLILDEVTASLDPEAEKGLVKMLDQIKKQMTIVAITHQSRLVEAADLALRVEDGKVVVVAAKPVDPDSSREISCSSL